MPFSSVLSRDGGALLEPWVAVREELAAAEAEVGVEGRGFTVILERALSVLEPVMELKREPASFLPIVTNRSGVEQRSRLIGHSHSTSDETGVFRSFHRFCGGEGCFWSASSSTLLLGRGSMLVMITQKSRL